MITAPFQLPGPLHAMDLAVFAELQEIVNDPDAGNSSDEDGNWDAAQESLCDCNLIEENDVSLQISCPCNMVFLVILYRSSQWQSQYLRPKRSFDVLMQVV